jgi:sugar lactone lactonase YvrE
MKLFCSRAFYYALAAAIGGLIAGSGFVGVDARAQTLAITVAPSIRTIAGDGTAGASGDGGPAINAKLNGPSDMAVDSKGNVYIADAYSSRVRKVDQNGVISTVAGTGSCTYNGDGIPAVTASVCQPYGIDVDAAGNLYIADTYNSRVRKVDTSGTISTIAGTGTGGFGGDGGLATSAAVNTPTEVAVDAAGNLFIADRGNYRVRKIDTSGIISTVAGNGSAGYSGDGGPAVNASFNTIWSVEVDAAGNLYVSDIYNSSIRKINTSGIVSTLTGGGYGFSGDGGPATNAQISNSYGLGVDAAGNVYIADTYNNRIRKISTGGIITTIAGNGIGGFSGDGGAPTSAAINNPFAVTVDAMGNIYIADINNQRIREIQQSISPFGAINVGQSSSPQQISLQINQALTISSISVPLSEGGSQEFNVGSIMGCAIGVGVAAGAICVVPVTFAPGFAGERSAPLVIVTNLGTFTFGLNGIGLAPEVTISPGVMVTVAGNGNSFSGDNGPATSAGMSSPSGVTRDIAGNMYIATLDNRVRKVASGGTITTVAGNGGTTYGGDNGLAINASFVSTSSVALDSAGNLYISDKSGQRVRKVDANGVITTVAGNGTNGSTGDGGPATSATLNGPSGITVDTIGNLFICDSGNNRVRKVDTSGTIITVAGTGAAGYGGDGGAAKNALLNSPQDLVFDTAGNLYISDSGNGRVRKIDAISGNISTVAGGGSTAVPSVPANGIPATSASMVPLGIAVDAASDLYIVDGPADNIILKVESGTGIIRAIAGIPGSTSFGGDNGPATSANLNQPSSITLDSLANIYIADSGNNRVREVSAVAAPTSFADTVIAQVSSPQSVIISNVGNVGLTGGVSTITTDFVVDPSGSCSSVGTVLSGTSCSLAMRFVPQLAGVRTGNVTITDNPLNIVRGQQQVILSGKGLPVTISLVLLMSTDNTIAFGTQTELTANMTPVTAGGATATGTITFFDGSTPLGSPLPISSTGEVSISPFAYASGTHSFTAIYTGDANFSGATSNAVSLVVSPPPIQVDLDSPVNPSNYGQTITITGTVTAGATGTLQFTSDGVPIGGPVQIVASRAAVSIGTLTPGQHVIRGSYGGSTVTLQGANSGQLVQLVNPGELIVTANNQTRTYDQPNATLGYTITGFIGADTEANSVAGAPAMTTVATLASAVGAYPIRIGLGTLSSSNYIFKFVDGSLAVTKATPGEGGIVGVTATSSANPSVWGQPVTLTAQLPATATGQVTFMDGSTLLGTGMIIGGEASFSSMQLAIATHPITAVYSGDTNFNGASSTILDQVVGKTLLAVIAVDSQRIYGQPNPVFTPAFSGFVNGDSQATVTGAAGLTTIAQPASPVGSYPILAGQGTLASVFYTFGFVSGTLLITPATPGVGPTPPVVIHSSTDSTAFGQPVTLTATLPPQATGTVQFLDGTTILGIAPIAGNAASLTISSLSVGAHSITAVYNGDNNYTTASSIALTVRISSSADFTVASSTGRQLIPPGASATFVIVVGSLGMPFTNSVGMSASGLPPGATFTFVPPTVTPGASRANTNFIVSVPMQTAVSRAARLGPAALALLLLPLTWVRRRRRQTRGLLLGILVTLSSLAVVSGCGTGGYFSQSEQTYTITVTGTSGSLVRSTTVTLTVE